MVHGIESNGHVANSGQRTVDALGNEFTPDSVRVLENSAIPIDEAIRFGVRAVRHPDHVPVEIAREWVKGPGILFEWQDTDRTVTQFRPDLPVKDKDGDLHKYIFPGRCGTFLGHLRAPVGEDDPILFVEGTRQGIAAAVWAPEGWGVVAFPGCSNWVGTDLSWAEGRRVVCLFDADLKTNRDVHRAATDLKEALEAEGAEPVVFASLAGARAKEGLDDVLGSRAPDKRTPYLRRIAEAAKKTPGRPPARKTGALFSDNGSLLAQSATDAVLEGQPAALAPGSMIALYRSGRYVIDRGQEHLIAAVQDKLGEDYRPALRTAIQDVLIGRLAAEGIRLPERMEEPLLNCKNGMLDLRTGELLPHDPSFLSAQQIPVRWDPDARCPTYEEWLGSVIPDQARDLEESASLMLNPSATPPKAVFAFGPSHSGKSTFLRIMGRMAGPENVSAVTLHQLSDDHFAAANIYGRMLNVAADLSSKHVADMSVFKMLTGEDMIHANRKYGREFMFTNQALFAFSANELPTVSEASRAYANRVKPFEFPRSFAGKEDPSIENRIMSELPGVLVRWVSAWQDHHRRGNYLPTDPRVLREFETRSDRVALWVSEKCAVHPEAVGTLVGPEHGTKKTTLHEMFKTWAQDEDSSGSMSQRKFLERLRSVSGVGEVRLRHANKNLGLNVTPHTEGETDKREGTERNGGTAGVESVRGVGSQPFQPYIPLSNAGLDVTESVSESETYGYNGPEATLHTPAHTPVDSAPCAEREELFGMDLETRGPDWLRWSRPEPFITLYGHGNRVDTSSEALCARLRGSGTAVGHNLYGFDLISLEKHTGLLIEETTGRIRDTRLQAWLADPPTSAETKPGPNHKSYSLDAVAQRVLSRPKDGRGKALAVEYCTAAKCRHGRSSTCNGWENIDPADPRFRAYCADDVGLALQLHRALPWTPYMEREMRVQAIMARMTLNGFRVDEDLLAARIRDGEARKADAVRELGERCGMPLGSASPLATKAGKEWLKGVYERFGVVSPPRTPKGALATSTEALRGVAGHPKCPEELRRIIELMGIVTSSRTIYGTIRDHVVSGRVHPSIWPSQASGRWSVTEPGLTVVGKNGELAAEREVFLPEPGERIIAVDLGQADARIVAAHAQDPAYIELFGPGRDVHKETAIAMMGDAKYRNDCKPISHLANYGGSEKKLISMGHNPELVYRFFQARAEKFGGLLRWQDRVRSQGEAGEILDNGFGRPMRVQSEFAYTQAPAQVGQGGTRDMMAEGLLELAQRAPEILPMLRAVVHDEVVLSAPEKDTEEVSRIVVDCLSRNWAPEGASIPVHFPADVNGPGLNWGHAYKV